jgi:predicted RNA binding protein YcfA (HicA-like mRNA interferase family)
MPKGNREPSRRASELVKIAENSPHAVSVRQSGSHRIVTSDNGHYVIFPLHTKGEELPIGTWRAIIKAMRLCGFLD